MNIATPPMPQGDLTDWGIDRIAFTYLVDPAQCDPGHVLWSTSGSQNLPGTDLQNDHLAGNFKVGDAAVNVRLSLLRNRCRIEFNPARILSPKSRTLCPPELLEALVAEVINQISQAAWPAFDTVTEDGEVIRKPDWPKDILLKRLDLARNFEVSHPAPVKVALEQKQPRWGKGTARYESSRGGWTIVNSTAKSGQDKFYDKYSDLAQDGDLRDSEDVGHFEGRLFRFETQLLRPRLKDLDLQVLDRLTVINCWAVLARRWDATGWGTPIATGGDLYRVVDTLGYAERADLVGYLMLKSNRATDGITPAQERRVKKMAKNLGLTVGLPLDAQGEPDAYLDITTGRLATWPSDVTADDPASQGGGCVAEMSLAWPLSVDNVEGRPEA